MSQADDLAARVKRFAIRAIKFARGLPRGPAIDGMVRQFADAATSQSANYGAARRGRSRREFVAKLGTVVEESDETEHWLAVIRGANLAITDTAIQELDWLTSEAAELRAIFGQSVRTARANLAKNNKSSNP